MNHIAPVGGYHRAPAALVSAPQTSQHTGEVIFDNRVTWNYFDEAGYVSRGKLQPGEDPYLRNKFNQEASDSLASNRAIPDTRNSM